jgi:hypothetical protein
MIIPPPHPLKQLSLYEVSRDTGYSWKPLFSKRTHLLKKWVRLKYLGLQNKPLEEALTSGLFLKLEEEVKEVENLFACRL